MANEVIAATNAIAANVTDDKVNIAIDELNELVKTAC